MSLLEAYLGWLAQPHPARPEQAVAGAPVRRGLRKGVRRGEATAAGWDALAQVWKTTPERVWAWSDLHLFHRNILRYTPRAVPDVDTMNQVLLDAAQARVTQDDWLVFAGDLSLGDGAPTADWLAQCPGHKALILGNHDVDWAKLTKPDWYPVWDQFEAIHVAVAWAATAHAPAVWLTHYPMDRAQIPAGTWNVHGHIHQHTLPGPFLNLSVEHQALAPQSLLGRLQAAQQG